MNKQGLSFDQHCRLGQALKTAETDMHSFLDVMGKAYRLNGREVRTIEKLLKAIDEARVVMDSAVFKEHPRHRTPDLIAVYFGRDETPSPGKHQATSAKAL
jgi:hypothetical protein